MNTTSVKNTKFEFCKKELRVLLRKLVEGNYHITAEFIYDHIANPGVDVKINPSLINRQSMEEFLRE